MSCEFKHDVTWQIMYRVDSDAVIIADVVARKTSATPVACRHNGAVAFTHSALRSD
jgi:hypothetical protein